MSNKFCTSCGAELSEETKFCTGCGAKVNEENAPLESVIASKAGEKTDKSPDKTDDEKKKQKRLIIIIASIVVGLAVIITAAVLIFQHLKYVEEHKPVSVDFTFEAEGLDFATSSGVMLNIAGADLDEKAVDEKSVVKSSSTVVELLRGEYKASIMGWTFSNDGTAYQASSYIKLTIDEKGATYQPFSIEDNKSLDNTTFVLEAVPAEIITDEDFEKEAGIMKDFGIDESSIKAFIALAEGRRTAELERIAEEKRLKEEEEARQRAEALRQAAFGSFPRAFGASSGAGAWGAEMDINSDGTFTYKYHDSNQGESGPGYLATMYVSEFVGKFSVLEQVSPTQFKLQLDYLRPSHQANESIDKDGLRTVYDEDEAYLLGKPTEKAVGGWTLYLPGQSTSVFNEEQRKWFNPYEKLGSTLDFCVITNGEYVWR